ncbi:cysteine dioxygenase [Psychroserpens sp. BH13MA-6]
MKSSAYLQNLIDLLSDSSKDDYSSILNNFNFEAIDFGPFLNWSDEKYTRNCLYRDSRFELILLCWEKGQETAVHGHDGEDCWVYLLEGQMEEVFYEMNPQKTLERLNAHRVVPKQLTFMNDRLGYHKLKNIHQGKSMSLHVYAKPIDNCVYFDEKTEAFQKVSLSYDTVPEPIE